MKYDAENKKFIIDGKAVIAFDNYNHQFGSPTLSLNRTSQMLNANFTVLGLSITPTVVDNTFVRHLRGRIVTSLPPRIFACYMAQFIANLKHAICDVNEIVSQPYCYYEVSQVVSDSIATIQCAANAKFLL